jgi:hypothetical protein
VVKDNFSTFHIVTVCAAILFTVSVCLANIRKDNEGKYGVPYVCLLVAFMLPGTVAWEAGTTDRPKYNLNKTSDSYGKIYENWWGDKDNQVKLSSAERWNQAEEHGAGLSVSILVFWLTWYVVRTEKVQQKLSKDGDYNVEQWKSFWAGTAVTIIIVALGLFNGSSEP